MIPPRNVPQEFRDKVAAEMTEATARANITLQDNPPPRPKPVPRRRCKGCGVRWDVFTPDCFTCACRKGARLETEYWKAMAELALTVSELIGRYWSWPPNPNLRSRAAIAGLYSRKPRR